MAFKNKGIAFLVGALTGSVVGSVTALLLAPKSGKELRGDIKAGTEKVIEAGADAIDQVSESVYEVSKKIEERAVKVVQGAKQGVQQAAVKLCGGKAEAAGIQEESDEAELAAEAIVEEEQAVQGDETEAAIAGEAAVEHIEVQTNEQQTTVVQ